jgi:hypothetical protein
VEQEEMVVKEEKEARLTETKEEEDVDRLEGRGHKSGKVRGGAGGEGGERETEIDSEQ